MKERWNVRLCAILMAASLGSAGGQELAPQPPVPPEPAAMAFQGAPAPPAPPVPPAARRASSDAYRAGQSALERRDYERAIGLFNQVVADKKSRADGALYWRAYTENRMGKRSEAIATLADLKKTFPGSRWLEDARALEVEVQQASGAPVSPENAGDDELKILALSGLVQNDPERAFPILEKILKGSNGPRVKERAMFVLAQSHTPKSRELMAQVATGKYNPDLQAKAVEYLGVFGGRENEQTLAGVYKSTNDVTVKRSILRGFMISGSKDALLSAARTESNPELRAEAIQLLSAMGAAGDLFQMYTPDAPVQVKRAILQALLVNGQSEKILEIARSDKDPQMRRQAIQQMGAMGAKSMDALPALYTKESDAGIKHSIVNALFLSQNAKGLIEIVRKETDPNLRREAVRRLSMMHSKDATDYLAELLAK